MTSSAISKKVQKYYDQEVKDYTKMYKKNYSSYPSNYLRMNIILDRLKKNKIKTILDVGCGTCGPMIKFLQEGYMVQGFDFSKEMIKEGKNELIKAGFSPDLIFFGDLENPSTLPKKKFDAIIASGVFPHIVNESKVLMKLQKYLNKNGKVFIEFRNDLFSIFTFNQYSLDFFLNQLLNKKSLSGSIGKEVKSYLMNKFDVQKSKTKNTKKLSYTDIYAKFHNPLSIKEDLFEPNNFTVNKLHFYHYHSFPTIFHKKYPKLFEKLSLKQEQPNDWRGYLMASAFVVEATKNS
ncbi:hypothetical protein C6990_06300 [Nitrosopumilus sp. b3]|uniref:class I SAM-dependent methyltransferase n=1 Tax=Nitrosopumilus sp. b3 TaxID=2109909 RepID=UPI0015F7047E|nr:class I SAM-dependent methyltransferase [Nitrosopumilus sp. b3]KAF6246727.1 hypothetical protein C6990_06300 [Nitrosopumilus sp. b3]